MIRRLSDGEIKLLESSTNIIKKDELCFLEGRKPNDNEKKIVRSVGKFSKGNFFSLRIFNICVVIGLLCVCLELTKGFVFKFNEIGMDNFISDKALIVAFLVIAVIDVLSLILTVVMIKNKFTNEKTSKLRQALKSQDYEILDAMPFGFKTFYSSIPHHLSKSFIAFTINGKDCFWFNIEGRYKDDGSNINKNNAMLLRFCVEVKNKKEYEYMAVVF